MLSACAVPAAQSTPSTDLGRAASSIAPATAAPVPQPPPPSEPPPAPVVEQGQPPRTATPAEAAIAKSNRAFAVSLYRQIAARPGNIFISPISIAGAFGPVAAGAKGQTRAEIGKALHFPADEAVLHRSLGSMLDMLESNRDGAQVSIANALWLKQGFPVKPTFLDLAKRSYHAEVDTLDFSNSPAAATRINRWVDRETNSRIPNLFEPNAFDDLTAVVVTNAVYFLGNWKQPFDPRRTRPQPFYLADGTTRQVPMMSADHMAVRWVGRGPGEPPSKAGAVHLLELPYKGDRLSMVVILPIARNGLSAVEAQLSAARLDDWLRRIDSAPLDPDVGLALPKVQIDSSYDLVKPLKALGIKSPFVPRVADFTGISPEGRRLYISDAAHKTFLKVDEKGTEAAAATGVTISLERGGAYFRADHPFLVLIRDKQTGAILFLGRITEP